MNLDQYFTIACWEQIEGTEVFLRFWHKNVWKWWKIFLCHEIFMFSGGRSV